MNVPFERDRERHFGLGQAVLDEAESDIEEDSIGKGFASITLSREDIARIRAPWASSLIIKTLGRSVGFMFLSSKIRVMWNPSGRLDCIDLGYDFFLIKFELQEDVDKVLKGVPWFVSQHFLAIRQWEPNFKASAATFSSSAVWIRLPELPIEYYEPEALKEIGAAIGHVLRIDARTVNGHRRRFARLCVQVNLEQPLIKTIMIGKFAQSVMYEWLNALCFSCGRVGHKKDVCPYLIRAPPSPPTQKNTPSQVDSVPSVDQQGDQNEYEPYRQWMVATRCKKPRKLSPKVQLGGKIRVTDVQVTTSSEGVEASTKEWVAVAWQKPPPGWVKLNTDGSSFGNPGQSGGGGLLRDAEGRWIIGFARNYGNLNSIMAELWALRDGLLLAKDQEIENLIVEIDALAVVHLMHNTTVNHSLEPLLTDCRNLLKTFSNMRIEHTFREANRCADAMSKLGNSSDVVYGLFESPPPVVEQLVTLDKKGVACNRLVSLN